MNTTAENAADEIMMRTPYGEWTRIADLKATTGMAQDELEAGIKELLATDDTFRAEPEPFGFRITDADRDAQVMIGGEYRHQIRFGA